MAMTIAFASYPLIKEGIIEWFHYLKTHQNDRVTIDYINELDQHYQEYMNFDEEDNKLEAIVNGLMRLIYP